MMPVVMPVVMTVAGFDPSGGAGIVADVKTFTAFGCFAAAAVTSLTYQNTTGVFGAAHQTTEAVRAQVLPVVEDFLVGVSTHTLEEARAARDGGADFATFGPVYDTPSKRAYGPPVGLEALREAAGALPGFPVVALGGISEETVAEVLGAGARGVAAIRMFADEQRLARALRLIDGGG